MKHLLRFTRAQYPPTPRTSRPRPQVRRATYAALLSTALVSSLLGSTPAFAAGEPHSYSSQDRGSVLYQWQTGGSGIKEAAEKALLGTDEDIANFLKGSDGIQRIDDRIEVGRVINAGGPSVRKAGIAALKSQNPADVKAFLKDGWQEPLQIDQRVEVGKLINAGGKGVKDAGTKALQGTPEDVARFINVDQYQAREIDNRVEVGKLMNAGGPNVKATGKVALRGTPDDVLEFLQVGQFVARSRDQEYANVAQLAEQAEKAGAEAAAATEASIEAKDRAVTASALAKEAAKDAAREAEAAGKDSKRAAQKARQAANAARGAAEAAQRAVDAASAANRASRVAALAAAQAANAAIGAADAAARALNAASEAANDAGKAEDAKKAATVSREAAAGAKRAADAAEKAGQASLKAAEAANASKSASANANEAASAADEAADSAAAAGADADRARAAAAETRRHALEANRAAATAESLARKSAQAAGEARDAANSAAVHAENAAKAAEEAAKHAGEAAIAADQSKKYADAAKAAADAATTAVTTAKKVFALARETEKTDLASRRAAAIERAKSRKVAVDEFTAQSAEALLEGKAIEDDTAALAVQADKPDANPKVIATQGRAVALRALKHFGSWRQEAAAQALAGTDDDVLAYLRTGARQAEQEEVRKQVADLATASPYQEVRTAAAKALEGTPDEIRTFYATGQYAAANVEYRIIIGKISNEGGPSVKDAAKAALTDGSPQALSSFLTTGQYQARIIDERVIAGQLMNAAGADTEMEAAARAALDGPADQLHDFIQVGQYMADRKDQLTATHVNQVQQLIHEADIVAAKAQQNRWLAAKAAAEAKSASIEADKAAAEAKSFADQAKDYAKQAAESAAKAETSASQAAKSASTARDAANRADQDAAAAEESAAQAEFSASYARDSAALAEEAKQEAHESALAANRSSEEAKNQASKAWDEVVKKREAELAEARRKAEEQRKKEQARQKKKPCIPYPARDNLPPCMYAVAGGSDEYYFKMPDIDPTMKEVVWEIYGLNDAKKCAKDPSFGSCSMAVISILPVGKLKLAKKGADGIKDLLKGTRYSNVTECLQCFLPGTKVLMADSSQKNIESVKVGDQVAATDPLTGETGPRTVTDVIVSEHDKQFNELTIKTPNGSEQLTATHEHPFWSPSQRDWVKAANLRAGMTLRAFDGTTVTVEKNLPHTKYARTYNLTVDDLHTFYVFAGTTPVLVHNSACPVWAIKALGEMADLRKTTGQIFDSAGKNIGPQLQSGEGDDLFKLGLEYIKKSPRYKRQTSLPGFKGLPSSSHAEPKFAAWMRQNKVKDATVVINQDYICTGFGSCPDVVAEILPVGSTMKVWYKNKQGALTPKTIFGRAVE
ncbi:hypothetical protein LE181_27655 [Streptomyces sp. SCA3-4]|uniref:polymorphic toxin-type HINT domain-containing protein n=1 Tax=Streptomyces sichuanensis TaxID=2871810 RepID=UPI001CE24DCB|nr:polymorphic toxin-type HINT domain-containing protein [Streptomyces sichuanensis]MCA6095926.1 hypothetical protein [Streptomyces sichuanensis]